MVTYRSSVDCLPVRPAAGLGISFLGTDKSTTTQPLFFQFPNFFGAIFSFNIYLLVDLHFLKNAFIIILVGLQEEQRLS